MMAIAVIITALVAVFGVTVIFAVLKAASDEDDDMERRLHEQAKQALERRKNER